MQRLLHRWFVQYNPLYLVSAMLVLGGTMLWSRGLAHEGSLYGELGVALIAELYAGALIWGAALLVRIRQRRPAVMLALLTILYQFDLTLHNEACAYLGLAGVWASIVWMLLFAGKLRALAWAMEIRVDARAWATLGVLGAGLGVLPHLFQRVGHGTALVAAWLLVLSSLAREGGVTSDRTLDSWGATVLRRTVRASWLVAFVLGGFHVLFWASERQIVLGQLAIVLPFVAIRKVRSEGLVWTAAAGTVFLGGLAGHLAPVAAVIAAALASRALFTPALSTIESNEAPMRDMPYRTIGALPAGLPAAMIELPLAITAPARHRLWIGSIATTYLAFWTAGSRGDLPAHVLGLDLALLVVLGIFLWRTRAWAAAIPPVASGLHFVVANHLVPAPTSLVQWGALAVVLGFVLLVGSLAVSWRLRLVSGAHDGADEEAHGP